MSPWSLKIDFEPVGLMMAVFEPEQYTQMYNCNLYDVEDIPLADRQSIPLGLMFFVLGFICQFMFYIACVDMLGLFICGLLTGYLSLVGAVYCSHPNLIYFMGSWAVCLWVTETTAEIVLAFNRCVELSSAYWADVLFHGKRAFLWMLIPTTYGLYALLFTRPGLFNGMFISWFFNPHVGYIDDFGKIYHNDFHTVHNYIVVVLLTGTYSIFAFILMAKTWQLRQFATAAGAIPRSQKTTFIQVILVSSVNAIGALLYVYLQFAHVTQFITVLAQFTWLLSHGTPPIIYLLINETVRRDVYSLMIGSLSKMLCCVKSDDVLVTATIWSSKPPLGPPVWAHRVAPASQSVRKVPGQLQQSFPKLAK